MKEKEFAEKFIKVFTKNIREQKNRKVNFVIKGKVFLWLLFNEKLVSCFDGDNARAEYDKVDKTDAFEIQYDCGLMGIGDGETLPLKHEHLTSYGIDDDSLPEFYVIGKDFSWCYVVTHEFNLCGPYFCYAP